MEFKKETQIPLLQEFYNKNLIEAGVDEAGRGCLAGPVVAAAVILKKGFNHPLIRDSKTLSAKQREELEQIIKNEALSYGIGVVDNLIIDEVNILNASHKAMAIAVSHLKPQPELMLIDGNRFLKNHHIKHKCFVKGDNLYLSIAAASILAKTHRDALMLKLAEEYPQYLWNKNKGYPTLDHRQAILTHGITPYHRKSFAMLANEKQLRFDF
jgi:ribonuclease HII